MGSDRRSGRARVERCRRRRDGADWRGLDLRRRRRHQHLQDAEDARTVARAIRTHARDAQADRGRGQAARRRHSRQRARRRARARAGLPLPGRDGRRESRPARSAARHHSRARAARSACRASPARNWRSQMCTDGKPVAASKAKAAGILDAIVDGDLLARRDRVCESARRGALHPEDPRHRLQRRRQGERARGGVEGARRAQGSRRVCGRRLPPSTPSKPR